MTDRHRELKSWDVGSHKPWDLKEESRINNPDLVGNFGRNTFSYNAELTMMDYLYWRENEAAIAHG